jgi:uracil-DNA glycosylase
MTDTTAQTEGDRGGVDAALQLLAWYREMGVDAALEGTAVDWTARGASRPGEGFEWPTLEPAGRPSPVVAHGTGSQVPGGQVGGGAPALSRPLPRPAATAEPKPTPRPVPAAPSRQFPTAAPDEAVLKARAVARDANSLDALRAGLMAFDGCALKATAKSLCFYRGAASAKLMLIGDAPTSDDDLKGEPFSGVEGQLLNRMLAAIGLTPEAVHIANAVYWRPPGNRRPTAVELAVCRPFLARQIALCVPSHIVLLGELALQHVLESPDKIMKARGVWREATIAGHTVKVLPMLHPSYLIKSPASKRLAWQDLLALKASLA